MTRRAPLPSLSRGVQTTGLYYNKALLDEAGLRPPATLGDLRAMVGPLGRARCLRRWCTARAMSRFNPLLVMWLLPLIAGRTGEPLAFVEATVKGRVGYDSPAWVEAFQAIADLRTSGSCSRVPRRRTTPPCSSCSCRARRP